MPRITELKDSRARVNEQGKVTVTRYFHVEFFEGDPTWTQAQADAELNTYGYTFGSAADFRHEPGSPVATETTVTLRERRIDRVADAHHLFFATLTYKSFSDDPRDRAVNDEEVVWDIGSQTTRIYRGRAAGPPDATLSNTDEEIASEIGDEGVPAVAPLLRVSVRRIHSAASYAGGGRLDTAGALVGYVNSNTPYSTPGGVRIANLLGEALFLGVSARQLDASKWEVTYQFLIDQAWQHKARWRARAPDTGEHDDAAITTAYIYRQADFSSLMADE